MPSCDVVVADGCNAAFCVFCGSAVVTCFLDYCMLILCVLRLSARSLCARRKRARSLFVDNNVYCFNARLSDLASLPQLFITLLLDDSTRKPPL